MPKLVIDSSVFISAVGEKNVNSYPSQQFFGLLKRDIAIIPILVVIETITILGKQGNKQIEEILDYLLSMKTVNIDPEFLAKTKQWLIGRTSLKTSDLLIAVTAKLHSCTLITWDKQLLKNAHKICPTLTPTQFPEKA